MLGYLGAAELPRHKGKQMYGPGSKWGTNPDAMIDKDFKRLSEVRAICPRLAVSSASTRQGGAMNSFKRVPHTAARWFDVVSSDMSVEPTLKTALSLGGKCLGGNGTPRTWLQHRPQSTKKGSRVT
jgi:hypothetical protein